MSEKYIDINNALILESARAYDYVHNSKGKNDECYTERYAVEPLLDYLEPFRDKIIWCPFDKEESEFVKVFKEYGYNVTFSHIDNQQDFFKYEPDVWDVMISNPPFTNKTEIFKRALSFGKPFALLMNILWLNDATPVKVFKSSGRKLQLLMFDKRMEFKNQQKGKGINFMSDYFCCDFLPEQIVFSDFHNRGQQNIFGGAL
jgi:hypothetical protein